MSKLGLEKEYGRPLTFKPKRTAISLNLLRAFLGSIWTALAALSWSSNSFSHSSWILLLIGRSSSGLLTLSQDMIKAKLEIDLLFKEKLFPVDIATHYVAGLPHLPIAS